MSIDHCVWLCRVLPPWTRLVSAHFCSQFSQVWSYSKTRVTSALLLNLFQNQGFSQRWRKKSKTTFQLENPGVVNFSVTSALLTKRVFPDLHWRRRGLWCISWEWLSKEAEISCKSSLEKEWEQAQDTETLFFWLDWFCALKAFGWGLLHSCFTRCSPKTQMCHHILCSLQPFYTGVLFKHKNHFPSSWLCSLQLLMERAVQPGIPWRYLHNTASHPVIPWN